MTEGGGGEAVRRGDLISTGRAAIHPGWPDVIPGHTCRPSLRSSDISFPSQNCPCLDDKLALVTLPMGHIIKALNVPRGTIRKIHFLFLEETKYR